MTIKARLKEIEDDCRRWDDRGYGSGYEEMLIKALRRALEYVDGTHSRSAFRDVDWWHTKTDIKRILEEK